MRTLTNPLLLKVASVAAAALLVTAAPEARACGGLFCSSTPVDQTAEHILFTINPDETVTAIVQISYSGEKDDFAWIVPVPGKPTLDTSFPQRAFQGLDAATAPQYRKNQCYGGQLFAGAPSAAAGAGTTANETPGVTVLAQQVVGPYDTTTLTGTTADAIVKWLQDNGYRITDKMIPILQPYVADGMDFVALKLTPDAVVTDITPLSMTYPGSQPMIPIKLTAVAAQPEMGIVAWVLANQRYAPDNYVDLEVPDSLIQFDQYGSQNNYLTLVSSLADKVGGEAFVTEYAQPSSEVTKQVEQSSLPPPSVAPDAAQARDTLLALLAKSPFITRLYTRISAEEMLDDPRFRIASDQSTVSNIHDLTDPNFDPSKCTTPPPPPPDPCNFNYCGRQGVCAPTAESMAAVVMGTSQTTLPSCVCANGATARPTRTGGQYAMYCEPLAMNLDSAAPAGATMTPALVPACEAFDCGAHGKCAPMNGNPTCICDAGYGATVQTTYDSTTGMQKPVVTCVAAGIIPPFPVLPPPGQTSLRSTGAASSDGGFCSIAERSSSRAPGSGLAWLLAAVGAAAVGRRRRGPA